MLGPNKFTEGELCSLDGLVDSCVSKLDRLESRIRLRARSFKKLTKNIVTDIESVLSRNSYPASLPRVVLRKTSFGFSGELEVLDPDFFSEDRFDLLAGWGFSRRELSRVKGFYKSYSTMQDACFRAISEQVDTHISIHKDLASASFIIDPICQDYLSPLVNIFGRDPFSDAVYMSHLDIINGIMRSPIKVFIDGNASYVSRQYPFFSDEFIENAEHLLSKGEQVYVVHNPSIIANVPLMIHTAATQLAKEYSERLDVLKGVGSFYLGAAIWGNVPENPDA